MMFSRVLRHELKNIQRDRMYKFFVIYPVIFAVIAYFLFPTLKDDPNPMAYYIIALVFILMNGFIFGAVTGFTLLDDRDDHVLASLKVSPIDVDLYVKIKLLLSYLFGVVATVLILITGDFLASSDFSTFLMIALLSPMQGPMVALLINAFASNKVEGFVIMKSSGIILLVPIAAIFLTDWKEIFLYIIPGFWSGRLILTDLMGSTYPLGEPWLYFVLGFIINLMILWLLFKLYQKKTIIV